MLTDWVRRGRPSGASLSGRELEILRLLSEGLTNREIAGRLHLSENTVKGHAKEIFDKLDVHNRVEAVMRATRARPAVATARRAAPLPVRVSLPTHSGLPSPILSWDTITYQFAQKITIRYAIIPREY